MRLRSDDLKNDVFLILGGYWKNLIGRFMLMLFYFKKEI